MSQVERIKESSVVRTAMRVQERYKQDGADPLAASIGFFGFLSLFPLMLLAVSLAGFLLDDPEDQLRVAEMITDSIPGFEAAAQGGTGGVEELIQGVVDQRGTVGVIGIVTLLLAGLRVVNSAMIGTRIVLRGDVQSGVMAKVRQLLALLGLGALALASAGASSIAGLGLGVLPDPVAFLISLATTFALDLLLFLGAYTLLSPTSQPTGRDHLPGALLAATGWTLLKIFGATYVSNQVADANALYGALGGVIALLLLLYLAGRLYLYGAELTAVRWEATRGALVPPSEVADTDQGPAVTVAAARGRRDDRASGDADGPPPVPRHAGQPRPTDPGARGASPSIQQRTQAARRSADASGGLRDPGSDARRTVSFVLAGGALVAGYRYLLGRDGG